MDLTFQPAIEQLGLVSPSTAEAIKNWSGPTEVKEIKVAEIDPEFSDTAKFCEKYDVDPIITVNCVIAEAVRGENRTLVACMIPANCRADLNKTVRKALDVRRVSFAPLEEVLQQTGMEYGGVTPIGLPNDWLILIDSRIANLGNIIIGGGYRKSKIYLPGKILAELPGAMVLPDLGVEILNPNV